MLKILFSTLLLVHLMSCFWFLVAKLDGFNEKTWVNQLKLIEKPTSTQYLKSCNWALQTLTTVGYGDGSIQTRTETVVAICWMFIGVGFYSFTIGNLASIISSIDSKAAHLQTKINLLSDFARRKNLPYSLERKIKKFTENNHLQDLYERDYNNLVNDLPSVLKNRIIHYTHQDIISTLEFFKGKEEEFIWNILPLFKQAKVLEHDRLYNQGDQALEIFFLYKGRVKFYFDLYIVGEKKPRLEPFCLFVDGSMFGDQDILIDNGRDGRDSTAIV